MVILMFSIHRMLFLALKKVLVAKITLPKVPPPNKKIPPEIFLIPSYSLLLFGKPFWIPSSNWWAMHQPNISHDIFWNLVFTLDLSSLLTDAPSAPSPITYSVPEKQKERKDLKRVLLQKKLHQNMLETTFICWYFLLYAIRVST